MVRSLDGLVKVLYVYLAVLIFLNDKLGCSFWILIAKLMSKLLEQF